MKETRFSRALAILAAILVCAAVLAPAPGAEAASGSDFDPGYIMSDEVFYKPGTMSQSQIQQFLNAKGGSCSAGYVCLKDYTTATTAKSAVSGRCNGYAASGSQSAATIIYNVAQSCGINPQVLIVLLQKEQGLVTNTAPSATRYRSATGYGCPDTAACDSTYYGFFNQVYQAAYQFKVYRTAPTYFNFRAGQNNSIQWHPNTTCGASTVYIRNQATAGLYNYTPYRPNAAALNNMYGSGDSCSSYGNRNFFAYFTDWFGSTTGPDVNSLIEWEYNAQGGAASLGAATSGLVVIAENGGGYGKAFELGSIYWSPGPGAKTVRAGAARDYYFARGGAAGPLGWPESNALPISQNGGGYGQAFTGGSLYMSPATGSQLVTGEIRTAYFAQNGAAGALGWPVGEELCGFPEQACAQIFQHGSIYRIPGRGTSVVQGAMIGAYVAAGGPTGSWGMPRGNTEMVSVNGGGTAQVFVAGSVFIQPGGTPRLVAGAIREYHLSKSGALGSLGWPIGDQSCSGTVCTQAFQYGSIILKEGELARVGSPEIEAAYDKTGGSTGPYGKPTSGLLVVAGGLAQAYQNGSFYWTASTGAFGVIGPIKTRYFAEGGSTGSLGWPIGDQQCAADGSCNQNFQNGSIYSSTKSGAHVMSKTVASAYTVAGSASGSWGAPTSSTLTIPQNGGGVGQAFANGSAYSAAGGAVYFVSGAIRDYYFAKGGAAGALGWPTGSAVCGLPENGCSQSFQGGTVYSSAKLGTAAVSGGILTAYAAAGGPSGSWGWPKSETLPIAENGGGTGQVFWAGSAFAAKGSSTGYFVSGGIRDFYFSLGGAGGSLGWPTGSGSCDAGGACTQQFQGGKVLWSAANGGSIG